MIVCPLRALDRGEQLVVFAEAEVNELGSGSERHPFQLDHHPAAGPRRDVAGVDREPSEISSTAFACAPSSLPSVEPKRRPRVRLSPERSTRRAERSSHDDLVAGYRPARPEPGPSARSPSR